MKNCARAITAILMTFFSATIVMAQQGDHLVASNLTVIKKNRLNAGVPYEASINIETPSGQGVNLDEMCFFWNKEGPFCFDTWEMRTASSGRSVPTVELVTGNPGRYVLTALMKYQFNGKTYFTNQIQTKINVRQ